MVRLDMSEQGVGLIGLEIKQMKSLISFDPLTLEPILTALCEL